MHCLSWPGYNNNKIYSTDFYFDVLSGSQISAAQADSTVPHSTAQYHKVPQLNNNKM